MKIFKEIYQRHEKAIIIGGGESLRGFDFLRFNDFSGAIITVNNAITFLPRADYWITIDMSFDIAGIAGKKKGCCYFAGIPDEKSNIYMNLPLHLLRRVPFWAVNKNEITGGNSGLAALSLACHFEAEKILMLGIDCYGKGHWYPEDKALFCDTKNESEIKIVENIPRLFSRHASSIPHESLIINGSIDSKIECFPKLKIEDALKWIGVK